MKAKRIICKETGEMYNSIMEAALAIQKDPKHTGKKWEGTAIAGKPIYRRLSLHVNGKSYMQVKGKEYFVKTIFGKTYKFE